MQPHRLIDDFGGLVTAVEARASRYKVSTSLHREKKTVEGWVNGAFPNSPGDVGSVIGLALKEGIDPSPFQTFTSIYDIAEHVTFEETIRNHPPDLAWLTAAHTPPKAEQGEIWGIKAPCPVGIASSPLTSNEVWTATMFDLGYGISTFKTRRSHHKESWEPPQIAFVAETPDLKAYNGKEPPQVVVVIRRANGFRSIPNLVNSIGVPSEMSVVEWQEQFTRVRDKGLLGLSVLGEGDTLEAMLADLEQAVRYAAEVVPLFIEINISCPNLKNPADLWRDVSNVQRIIGIARQATKGSDIKLTLKVPHLPEPLVVELLSTVGQTVDALAFRNTVRVEPVMRQRSDGSLIPAFPGRKFGGLSGPCTFGLTLRAIRAITAAKKKVGSKIPIIAIGGASSPEDVAQLLDEGAAIVQTCTAAMFDPLFAWKTRHQLSGMPVSAIDDDALPADVSPRPSDHDPSWATLQKAVGFISRKYERDVTHRNVMAVWQKHVAQQPTYTTPGLGQREHKPVPVVQWVKRLMEVK